MSDLDERVSALSPEQRALLQKRLNLSGLSSLLATTSGGEPGAAEQAAGPGAGTTDAAPEGRLAQEMHFSLLFFSGDGAETIENKYRLLIECAKRADRYGFAAVWTPERHFHPFGGLYPNPSVLGAALAMVTERVQIRAGSVVLPLHDPVRVAEEWSIVDNLSHGRVALSFASGWSMDDFIFAPDAYADRKSVMLEGVREVQRLWAGESSTRRGVNGATVEVRIFPRPLQPQLPIWLSSAGSPETFVKAGELGAHVLTSLIGQTVEQLGEKIALYRQALARHDHDPQVYRVALMLHTFVGGDINTVKEQVRRPMYDYLRTNLGLHAKQAQRRNDYVEGFNSDDEDALLGHAFERYFNGSSLLGTPASCMRMVDRLRAIGVNEVACLVDFGVDVEATIAGIDFLNELKERSNPLRNAT